MKLFNKLSTREKRKNLRKEQTEVEKILWQKLRAKRFFNLKFFRQYGIGEYIADFYCPEMKIVIELDGSQHYTEEGKEYDKAREGFMEACGIKTFRFSNRDIVDNLDSVLEEIYNSLNPSNNSLNPSLKKREER